MGCILGDKTCSRPVYLSVTQSSKLASGFFRRLLVFGGEGRRCGGIGLSETKGPIIFHYAQYNTPVLTRFREYWIQIVRLQSQALIQPQPFCIVCKCQRCELTQTHRFPHKNDTLQTKQLCTICTRPRQLWSAFRVGVDAVWPYQHVLCFLFLLHWELHRAYILQTFFNCMV